MPGAFKHLARPFSAAALLALAIAVVPFASCTGGGSTPIDTTGGSVAAPIVLHALATSGDPMVGDPLTNAAWKSVSDWHVLTGALNDPRSGPATRGAVLYDAQNLYVAFIGEAPAPASAASVEFWLDSTAAGDGKELLSVSVRADGTSSASWFRSKVALQPKVGGAPDTSRPVNEIPNRPIDGLRAQSGHTDSDGKPVWTVVIKLPLHSLPTPLQVEAREGAKWRCNLIRYDVNTSASGPVVVQSNVAPIYQAMQPVSPYRMADVVLDGRVGAP